MTTPATDDAALPYHEPGIVTILILASFTLLLNLANHIIDRVLYCGLIAQILLGIAWGTPGGNWLGREFEHAVVNLGYLGLLLIVYEGGLATSFKALKDNLILSVGVAVTGIALPIALSYILLSLVSASSLQAFAAGAALCSTSLGTTFTVLSASNLTTTRLGTVLTSAAMMDDVIGLIMVQIISNLGTSSSAFSATDVVRPVFVSLAFIVVVPLIARFVVLPLTLRINKIRKAAPDARINRTLSIPMLPMIIHTLILVGLITAALYAGTSGLLAAYLAGASITWWDTDVPHFDGLQPTIERRENVPSDDQTHGRSMPNAITPGRSNKWTGAETFDDYYAAALQRILKPFFFASIGFSVPITRMFSGEVVWKGIIYAVLMFIGKFLCGLWLMRIPGLATRVQVRAKPNQPPEKPTQSTPKQHSTPPTADGIASKDIDDTASRLETRRETPPQSNEARPIAKRNTKSSDVSSKPISLYPGCILGSAMVARGEIGFLISAIAESNGIFGSEPSEPIFLVVTWAIMICTIVGPLMVGTMVRRVKRLETQVGGTADRVLGIWGPN